MNELSQPLFQLHAPFIVLTAKSSIEVQASITYAFVSACTDSIIISIPRGTRLFTSNSNKRDNAGLIQCEIISHREEIDANTETLVRIPKRWCEISSRNFVMNIANFLV